MSTTSHHLRGFNLPPGTTTQDLDPADQDEQLERLYQQQEERGYRLRDDEMLATGRDEQ